MAITIQKSNQALGAESNTWIREGWRMAQVEGPSVVGSIERTHTAEVAVFETQEEELKARGHILLKRKNEADQALERAGYEAGRHLRELAQGRLDLWWAIALSILNAALIVFVLLAFGPSWLALLLAFTVLASTVAVEEFFCAYDERTSLREGLFLTLAILALGAQFWLGMLRGMFLTAVTPEAVGPVTEMMGRAGSILQYSLGLLALVTECLCGYKWYRVRAQLFSETARAVRERDWLNQELVCLHRAVVAARHEADVRRSYREVGARQFLATEERTSQEPSRGHFQQAVIGALIALIVLALLGAFFVTPAAAAQRDDGRVIILLDRTKSLTSDDFVENTRAVEPILNIAPLGWRVIVASVTDSFGRPEILLDEALPAQAGYLGLDVRMARERLAFKWRETSKTLAPVYDHSDIIGSLVFLQYLGPAPARTVLVVLSDLRQNTNQLDLEHVGVIKVESVLKRLEAQNSVPTLAGTHVYLLGVSPKSKTAAYYHSLRDFWIRLFSLAGADVRVFAANRQLTGF